MTVPLPVPLAPAVTAIQLSLLATVHVQPAAVLTETVAEPPLSVSDCAVGETEYVHDADAAAWVTAIVCPATSSVPVRGDVAVFASTV